MKNIPLDVHDEMPKYMKRYIDNYGWHFNKQAYEYAVSYMKVRSHDDDEKGKEIKGYSKEEIDSLLKQYNIKLDNKIMYDYIYVATMCKADYQKSITDEKHMLLFIKETVDDIDASPETTFRRWVATMIGNGIPIDWAEIC